LYNQIDEYDGNILRYPDKRQSGSFTDLMARASFLADLYMLG